MSNATLEPYVDDEQDESTEFLQPRAPTSDDELDITPMIDITFLLLIFFLVSSKMTAEQAVPLPPAKHGSLVSPKESVIVIMKRGTGDEAEVQKSDGTPFSSDIEQQNAEVAEYIQQGLDSGKKHVIIRAEETVRHGEIGRVSEAIGESMEEGQMINIAVMEQG
ncbi:ExbD/TolR family protein [Aureliella helgolandensis]|uniref:Biopolymer transport protein ExbD/TolR n=1 Tax=Aureliella helgolandensis TaxID=2527968 RepID=A0A518GFL8_9BACT|nr:biopolymer transporter ExbD [Aureliella helgolandensis]QDV27360.1 Biopolymer transport protein ExbD/TolR [Aureliella helgolandensis]